MGNFISVYSEDPRQSAAIASKSEAVLHEILQKNPDLTEAAENLSLARLISGDFIGGEQADGHHFVRAFRAVCATYAAHTATVEIYVDEEQFPEIWDFVWDAPAVSFGLPQSEFGSPAVGYWDVHGVQRYIDIFAGLDFADVADRNDGCGYEDEIAELAGVLRAARDRGRGVYVFLEE